MAIPNERQEVMDMPAAYAHYVFGKKVFQELSGTEKEIIRKGEDAFLLGLHGPDLLFYYFPLCKNRINQQGVKLHKKIAAEFLNWEESGTRKIKIRYCGRIYMDSCVTIFWTASVTHTFRNIWKSMIWDIWRSRRSLTGI